MSIADVEHGGTRFICCEEVPSEQTHFQVGAYPCKPAYEPASIRTGYALGGFFAMVMKGIYDDWLMEQPDDVQHIIEAYWGQDEGAVSPVHYNFESDDDGRVISVHFYLERRFYLNLPRV